MRAPSAILVRSGAIACGVTITLVVINWLAFQRNVTFDLTATQAFSLSPATHQVLQEVAAPVTITYVYHPDDPELRLKKRKLEQMRELSPHIQVKLVNFLTAARELARGQIRSPNVVIVRCGEREQRLSGFDEAALVRALIGLSHSGGKTIYFLDGHGEDDVESPEFHDHVEGEAHGHSHGQGGGKRIVHYQRHGLNQAREALRGGGYTVKKLLLIIDLTVPEDCAVLVIARPRVPLLVEEVQAVKTYLQRGGRCFLLLDPFLKVGPLTSLLAEYGIRAAEDFVIDPQSFFFFDPSVPVVSRYPDHPITRDLPATVYPGACSLTRSKSDEGKAKVRQLCLTSTQSWGERAEGSPHYDAGVDGKGPLTLLVLGEARDGRGMIAVAGDADFATNSFFSTLGNGILFTRVVGWLADERPVRAVPLAASPPRLTLTNRQVAGMVIINVVIPLLLVFLWGVFAWWRRRA